jgi:sigma-B regulation protein RsbU (phosphoserine phosphatase)
LKHDGSPVEFEQATGQPLGLFADLILDEGQVDLPEKGMLSLYTDGITNAINARSIPFGQGNLLSVLKDCMHEKARTSVDKVWSAVKDHRGEEDQHDDLTLLILKAK